MVNKLRWTDSNATLKNVDLSQAVPIKHLSNRLMEKTSTINIPGPWLTKGAGPYNNRTTDMNETSN